MIFLVLDILHYRFKITIDRIFAYTKQLNTKIDHRVFAKHLVSNIRDI